MIPRFSLARPRTLDEAFVAFDASAGEGAYYAGGTELLQVMKMGFAQFATLIDLKAIEELRGIGAEDGGGLRIGAVTTHREIENAPLVRERLPGLARLEQHVANVRVRNAGTLGGNLAFAEPHSDPATFLLACGAELELAGADGRRRLGVADLVLGPLFTAREPEEILVAIRIPAAARGEGRGYAKIKFFERPAASIGIRVRVVDGHITDATVTAGSLTETPVVVAAASQAMVGVPVGDGTADGPAASLEDGLAGARAALADLDAVGDLNGSADYKRHLAGVLIGRAVRDALGEVNAHA